MIKRYEVNGPSSCFEDINGSLVDYKDYQELEAENARLRQQRDAANAQLDWLIEQTGTKRVIRSNMDECD